MGAADLDFKQPDCAPHLGCPMFHCPWQCMKTSFLYHPGQHLLWSLFFTLATLMPNLELWFSMVISLLAEDVEILLVGSSATRKPTSVKRLFIPLPLLSGGFLFPYVCISAVEL